MLKVSEHGYKCCCCSNDSLSCCFLCSLGLGFLFFLLVDMFSDLKSLLPYYLLSFDSSQVVLIVKYGLVFSTTEDII